MYFEGSAAGKTLKIGIEISPTNQKVRNLALFSTSLKFVPPAFENAARYSN